MENLARESLIGSLFFHRKQHAKSLVRSLIERTGIELDGSGPNSIRVLDERTYDIAISGGFTGLRDAYVDGLWDAERLDVITDLMLTRQAPMQWANRTQLLLSGLSGRLRNRQSRARNSQSRRHYNLGNDLYQAMLDRRMVYSCAYWRDAKTLDEAQEAKLDLICRKLGFERGMRVLDIGCGWGSFAKFAAERYGVSVLGITISEEQARMAVELCAGLPIEIRVMDYRDLSYTNVQYDRVVSIGMFEHVGYQNYRRYMKLARKVLVDDGLFLLHTIGGSRSMKSYDPWMDQNIFPNAMLPSSAQIAAACEGSLLIEDWHSFGPDYDKTLMCWWENFDRNWPALKHHYDERFYRIWKCYLLTCAGTFRALEQQLWQVVLSPSGVRGGYQTVR